MFEHISGWPEGEESQDEELLAQLLTFLRVLQNSNFDRNDQGKQIGQTWSKTCSHILIDRTTEV